MRPAADIFSEILADNSVTLTRQDLINMEHSLKDAIHSFAPFTSYSLYFPREGDRAAILRYDPAARELMLPLTLDGRCLGVFVARGVRLKAPKAEPPLLAALAGRVLGELLLYKRSVTDPLTGLANRDHFQKTLTQEIDLIRHCMDATSGGRTDPDVQCFSAALGVILLDLDCFQWINERYGYALGDRIAAGVGRAIAETSPGHVTTARLHNDTFAILAPDASPKASFQLAEQVRQAIGALSFQDEITGDRIGVTASLGSANYPQSLRGPQLERSPAEQARILLRAAQKAVGVSKDLGRNQVFAFQDIARAGGRIIEALPMQRFSVTLGRGVGAQEGMRYLVWSPKLQRTMQARLSGDERLTGRAPELYKGEVVLTEVQQDLAVAEVLHAGDPTWPPEPGDRLTLISERDSLFAPSAGEGGPAQRDMLTGLYGYRDFLAFFGRARLREEAFALVLARVVPPEEDTAAPERRSGGVKHMDAAVARVAALAESILPGPGADGKRMTGGRAGLGGLVHFLPGRHGPELAERAAELVARAMAEHGLELAIGLYAHPFLSFAKADALDCARKALEHAMLLPPPHVALFDSVSLNVAADRLFAEGDLYAAVEEFKLSLAADENNMLARNSLGICYAQLGKTDLALIEFERVAEAEPDNLMVHYNMGRASQRLGDAKRARRAFERCLELDPTHCFSLLGLGALAEAAGEMDRARDFYERARAVPGGEASALRPLARVALASGKPERARELLHLALSANHNDAYAMGMLARLYLDAGEDPQIAEVLARQAAALMPERKESWDALVEALTRQGRLEEAREAAARRG